MRLTHAFALLALAPAVAAAQRGPAAAPVPRFGILAGLNSATLSTEQFFDDDGEASSDRRNGFVGGVFLALPLGTSNFAFRPEVLYAQKGARYNASFAVPPSNGVSGTVTARGEVRLGYVEVPLLVQYTAPTAGRVRPQLYAGPALAVRASCEIGFRFSASGFGAVSESADCDDLGELLDEDTPEFRRFDVGGVVGGALGFDVGGRALAVGVRYTHGFVALVEGDDAPKNRTIGVHASVEFATRRGPR